MYDLSLAAKLFSSSVSILSLFYIKIFQGGIPYNVGDWVGV